jgi:hypothetical protein
MKITIEDIDIDYYSEGKKIVYESSSVLEVANDWDFFFDNLRQHRDTLKLRKNRCETLGGQISLQAQIDKLETLFGKYIEFINIAEHWRHVI